MKKFILLLFIATVGFSLKAQVAINNDGTSPDASSMLDVQSSLAGILVPRMTDTQRDAIPTPATGLMVYVTTDNSFYFYSGSEWIRINSLRADDPSEPIPIKFQGTILYVHPSDNSAGITMI